MKPLISLLVLLAFSAACGPAQIVPPTPTATTAAPTQTAAPTSTPQGFVGRKSDEEFAARELNVMWIDMVDTRHGWALIFVPGGPGFGPGPVMLATTADGGATWTDKTPARSIGTWPFYVLDAETALWFGEPGVMPTGETGLLRTVDGGLTWNLISAPWSLYTEIKSSTSTDGFAITDDGSIFETQDAGASWQAVSISGPGQVHETPCDGCDRSTITIHDYCRSCGDTLTLRPSGEVIITHVTPRVSAGNAIRLSLSPDLGKTWQDIAVLRAPDVAGARSAWALAPIFFDALRGLMWIMFSEHESGCPQCRGAYICALYSTADGGRSWAPGSALHDCMQEDTYNQAISATDVFAPCGPNLCVTRDAGQTWVTIKPNKFDYQPNVAGQDYPDLRQLDFVDPLTGWAIVSGWPDFVHHLYRTTDGGYTWNLLSR